MNVMLAIASTAIAGDLDLINRFISDANTHSVARDYEKFKSLYCDKAPNRYGEHTYFEDKNRIFTGAKLRPMQSGYFGDIKYDYILDLCSETKSTKELCIVEPVIKKGDKLCILNYLQKR